jgi:tetratricopeptide (TPR) repeat protein
MITTRLYGLVVMSRREKVEEILSKAKEWEKDYEWAKAAKLCKRALSAVGKEDFLKKGQILERISHCLYRAAFQAETQEEFRRQMQLAVEAYERAADLFKRGEEAKGSSAKILHCRAMVAYIGHWLAPDPDTKRELLDGCWGLEKEALKAYDEAGDRLGLGETCVRLTSCLADRLDLELDTRIREKILDEALGHGEKAIKIFSKAGDEHELARAYCITSIINLNAALSLQLETKRRKCEQKAFDYAKEAIRISEGIGDKLLLGRSTVALGFAELDLGAGSEAASELFRKAVQCGIETKDHRILSDAFDGLASSTRWSMMYEEDSEKVREMSRQCEEYASEAIGCSILADYGLGIPHSYSFGYVQNFRELARREINLETRHKLLKKAVALGKQGLEHAQRTGSTHAIFHISYGLFDALYYLSTMKTGLEKRQFLEDAMTLGEKLVFYTEQLRPQNFALAWSYEALALILFELSTLEESGEKRKELLEKSVSHMETCVTVLQRHMTSAPPRKELFAWEGIFHTELGNILDQLYRTTSEEGVLRKLIDAYQGAARMNKKADLVSRVAEAYWQIAKTYNQLAEYSESAKNFESASENYRLAAEKIPQLTGFYSDYASYMRAWAELEKSRHEHENENYVRSREHYRMCSRHLEMTKKWSYLSSYYFAWSLLEHGEALSRLDKPQGALKAFSEAGRTFGDSADSLREKVGELENSEERDEAFKLTNIARLRKQYCMGRVLMEEAKLSNRKGDKISSAKKYASAARIFREIAPNLEREEARGELQFAATICQAWEKMELAEERGDAVLYRKAAELFAKAGEISRRKTAELTAIGNSCFCEALELGMKFMATSNMDFYSGAKLRMETAAGYYRRAGFEKPALWVEATKRLFDAYVYVGKAEAEADPEKRVRFYLMAEKCLELSAKFYGKAEYRDKKNEALQSLERVRKERELAFSLSEVLKAPAVLSSTTGVSMPDSTEKAAGLNDFESVNIRARLSVPKEFTPGEKFQVKLDLANVGKKAGLLVRIEGLVPRRCKVLRVPSYCAMEDDSLNMGGRRLKPLSVESVSIWVQIREMVGVNLSPRVVYVDELGNFRTIRVEETKILPIVEFESKVAQVVFNYLVNAFVEDCVKRRLSVEKSGWRSFPQIIRGAGVSKRSLYGDGGLLGHGLSELQRKGLIHLKTFRGERGRGGHILRARIHHKKELVRRYIKEKAPDVSM